MLNPRSRDGVEAVVIARVLGVASILLGVYHAGHLLSYDVLGGSAGTRVELAALTIVGMILLFYVLPGGLLLWAGGAMRRGRGAGAVAALAVSAVHLLLVIAGVVLGWATGLFGRLALGQLVFPGVELALIAGGATMVLARAIRLVSTGGTGDAAAAFPMLSPMRRTWARAHPRAVRTLCGALMLTLGATWGVAAFDWTRRATVVLSMPVETPGPVSTWDGDVRLAAGSPAGERAAVIEYLRAYLPADRLPQVDAILREHGPATVGTRVTSAMRQGVKIPAHEMTGAYARPIGAITLGSVPGQLILRAEWPHREELWYDDWSVRQWAERARQVQVIMNDVRTKTDAPFTRQQAAALTQKLFDDGFLKLALVRGWPGGVLEFRGTTEKERLARGAVTNTFYLAPDGKAGDRSPDEVRAEWLAAPRSRGLPTPIAAPAALLGAAAAGAALGAGLLATRPPPRGRGRTRIAVWAWAAAFTAAAAVLAGAYLSEVTPAQAERALGDPFLILAVVLTAAVLALTATTARNLP